MNQIDHPPVETEAVPCAAAPSLAPQQEFLWLHQIQNPEDVLCDALACRIEADGDPAIAIAEVIARVELPQLTQAHVFCDDGAVRPRSLVAPPDPAGIAVPSLADAEAALHLALPPHWHPDQEPALRLVPLSAPDGAGLAILRHRLLAESLPFHLIRERLERNGLKLTPLAEISAGSRVAPADAADEPGDEVTHRILAEFRETLGRPGMGPHDDFFDQGGHSLVATRIIGRLQNLHGIELRFTDLFSHPTAAALARLASQKVAAPGVAPAIAEDPGHAPLSLAQQSLWKAYAAFGYGDIFNIPFALRFLSPVDEQVFARAFHDLIARHPILRSHFGEENGEPFQKVVPVAELGNHRWFWTSTDSGSADRRSEARHVFDLRRELPLRLRFFRDEQGRQELSMLFHHIVLDEWSLNLLMDELAHAYRQRAAGLEPVWPDQPPGFHLFAARQRASDPDGAHLAYWVERLRDAPKARPIFGTPRQPGADEPSGGWVEMALPAEVAEGLHATARRNAASLFNVVYAAIAAALGRLGGFGEMVIGTSASGRDDPAFFDTVGYFTTMMAHRIDLDGPQTPAGLIAQVRDTINESLPHAEIPLDLVGEAISSTAVRKMEEMFEVFIQIHAQNRMNGAFELMDGRRIGFRQIDPDKTESILGLQFEVLEEIAGEARGIRIMMSYRADRYGPAEVARLRQAVPDMMARFAQPDADRLALD